MSGAVITYLIEGHRVEYSRETEGRYVCRNCGVGLLSAMQFYLRECKPATPADHATETTTEGDRA